MKSNYSKIVLAAIILLSIIINYWHINFGLVQSIYPDEAFFDGYAFRIIYFFMGNSIDYQLDPPVYSICLAFLYGIYFIIGYLIGTFSSIHDFIIYFSIHRENFILIGRILSAGFAVGSIPILYSIAKSIYNEKVALLSAFSLTISYPFVWFAHTQQHTTISIFISLLILFFAIKTWKSGSSRDYILCGICAGVGIGTKIYPALFGISLAIIHFYRNNPFDTNTRFKGLYRLVFAGVTCILIACICYPFPILEYELWENGMKHTMGFYNGGNIWDNFYYTLWGKSEYYSNTSAEPFSFWSNSLRITSETTILIFGISFIYALIRHTKAAAITAIPFLIFLSYQTIRGGLDNGTRQFYFLLPVIYMSNSVIIIDIYEYLKKRQIKLLLITGYLVIIIPFIQPVIWLHKYLTLISNPTTLELGREWIDKNIPTGSTLLLNYEAPYVNISSWSTDTTNFKEVIEYRSKSAPPFHIIRLSENSYEKEIVPYRGKKNVYVILSDYNSTVYYKYENAKLWGEHKYDLFTERTAYYNHIYRNSKLIYTIWPKNYQAMGPVIHIYKLQ
jgi:4-amino-4-deoxy-L-arabinose transferase-like glycosyltransferase